MTHKHLLLTLAMLMASAGVWAGEVSRNQAYAIARQFMQNRGVKLSAAAQHVRGKEASTGAAYYVFNTEGEQGFVIVSADDRTVPVLGYTTAGHYDESAMPDNMKAWLAGYADQLSALSLTNSASWNAQTGVAAPAQTAPAATASLGKAIAPLITAHWTQRAPYNGNLPEIDGRRSVTGCVALAMAQILNYYKAPADLPAIRGYILGGLNNESLPGIKGFNWGNLKDTYDSDETADDVASLLRYCSQAVRTAYGTAASSAVLDSAHTAFDVFGFGAVRFVRRETYTNQQWEQMIYDELAAGRPVMYSGVNYQNYRNEGHDFICDGYDGNGLFHINWGWGGELDGYFSLSLLNVMGPCASDGFNMRQSALINIQPAPTEAPILMANGITYKAGSQEFKCNFYNLSSCPSTFEMTFGHEVDGKYKNVLLGNFFRSKPIGPGGRVTTAFPVNYLNQVTDGEHKLVPLYRQQGEEEWHRACPDDETCIHISYLKDGSPYGNITVLGIYPKVVFSASAEMQGTCRADEEQKVVVTVKNDESYCCPIIRLEVLDPQMEIQVFDKAQFYLTGNGTTESIDFAFTPTSAGTYTLRVYDDGEGTLLQETTVTVSESTGIAMQQDDIKSTTDYISLQGLKTANPQRGIYIRNRKKFLVK